MNDGDFLEIEYVGKISETGEIFDLTDAELAKEKGIFRPTTVYGPITIILGAHYILPALDDKVKALSVGDEKTIKLAPKEAFGERDTKLLKTFSMAWFKQQRMAPVVGQYITLGNNLQGRVLSVSGGRVRIDFNHPLAGKALEYDVKINKKLEKSDEQVAGIVTFYTGILPSKFKVELDGKSAKITMPKGVPLNDEIKKMITENITKYVKGIESADFAIAAEKADSSAPKKTEKKK